MLPTQFETVEAIISRLPAALSDCYRQVDMMAGQVMPPGTDRKHVFDLVNGVRLIASLIERDNGHRRVHLAYSLPNRGMLNDLENLAPWCKDFSALLLRSLGRQPQLREQVMAENVFNLYYAP